jgi:hypothetical protein
MEIVSKEKAKPPSTIKTKIDSFPYFAQMERNYFPLS